MNTTLPTGYSWRAIGNALVCYNPDVPFDQSYRVKVWAALNANGDIFYRYGAYKPDGCVTLMGVKDYLQSATECALIEMNYRIENPAEAS